MTWFFGHEATASTDDLQTQLGRGAVAVVPLHWRLEVGNVLLMAERKKLKTQPETTQFLALLSALPIETDNLTNSSALGTTVFLAREHRLTTYDAAYLDLALRRGLPIATLDRELRAVATKLGVGVLPKDR